MHSLKLSGANRKERLSPYSVTQYFIFHRRFLQYYLYPERIKDNPQVHK